MKQRRCEHCRAPLSVGGARGRTPTFCSNRCRTAAHRSHPVPTEMRQRSRWIGYGIDRAGEPRPYWLSGYGWHSRDLTDPSNWESWDRAKTTPPSQRGFILGDGIGCLTIDGCVHAAAVHPDVLAALRALDTYAEITPNGTGVQVLVLSPPTHNETLNIGGHPATVASTPAHWVPLTGRQITGTPLRCAALTL